MMVSLLYTFRFNFYLINIHIFDYPDSRLSGLFTKILTTPDNRGATVFIKIAELFSTLLNHVTLLDPLLYETQAS